MYTDSHCHLNRCPVDFDDCLANKVRTLLTISCHFGEKDALIECVMCARKAGLKAGMSIGVHPCQSAKELLAVTSDNIIKHDSPMVWAVGESGLDYYHDDTKKKAQAHSFAEHIHASQALGKALVVHTRAAINDTLDLMAAERACHGVMHCFSEDITAAKRALDMGFYISFSGVLTFKNADSLRDVAKYVPLDRVLIETDSPYLAPIPYRGKTNVPHYVVYVAKTLAGVHGIDADSMGNITSQNFVNLIGKGVIDGA